MANGTNYFTTYDLHLSVSLLTLGFSIDRIDRVNGKGLFYFEQTPQLVATIDNYYKDVLSVSPLALFHSLKTVKNRLYSGWGQA